MKLNSISNPHEETTKTREGSYTGEHKRQCNRIGGERVQNAWNTANAD